mmetsp:Transcript_127625/g.190271  ORF Transcript_127625/g.190271 Transcript_127625/m.190271 type:complete len:286 (+) Transcript_127625:219-1076(+)|eukprot:CAMPEP_0117008716 /NCGR_PEP_ID=MMETSP0472-20121206/8125_1 /TAXON_ID=693140 ORGANISM="Tiarina fusus, Strain LIS" /NCGR_SAMPLE_ID=MMETSP0472 /ASSEMBLY_ACC=CAM_ASM_000603 /LENGTH=285 /DNA_ID=CAMNT_0004710821 /DNA_START=219 /DNA_END=1076 /DNA_ORIENTATION=+
MSREGQPDLERSSSFARSLYQAAQQQDDGGYENGDRQNPPGMGRRQRSRRRLSNRGSGGNRDGVGIAAAAAAASVNYEEGEPTENLPHMGDGGKVDRHTSWYTDALLQGGTEDLSAILGQVQDSAAAVESPSADDEVLEQYRIMAHVEANIRVKDNTGFDMAEYEKRRKMNPEPTKGDYYSGNKKPKPKLPEPRLVGGGGSSMQRPEEPPLPPARPNRRFIEQRTPKVPELSPGIVVRGPAGQMPDGEHVVRCLGCKLQLRVNMIATLVQCPECSTVSPASSTRH